MQALLHRSMIENKNTPNKSSSRVFADALVRTGLILWLSASFACLPAFAQQATAKSNSSSPFTNATVTQTAVDETIPDDARVKKIISPYSTKVRELETVIGKLDDELRKTPIGGGSLGNFATDGLRARASHQLGRLVPLMITNSGGLRKNVISPGELRAADIFELMPFENALIEVELTGQQVIKLLEVVLKGRDAQSGARIRYRLNAENTPEPVSIKLLSADGAELDIDPNATYRIVTIDYLLNLGSGSYALLKEGNNAKPIGVTMRDAMMEYVKSETAAGRSIKPAVDNRFELVGQP